MLMGYGSAVSGSTIVGNILGLKLSAKIVDEVCDVGGHRSKSAERRADASVRTGLLHKLGKV